MADETFAQALTSTYLPFAKMNLDQKNLERQAIRDQANLIFQQERQKALENHYIDMGKHQVAQDLQAAINQKAKEAKEEKDRSHAMYKEFNADLNKKLESGMHPGEAWVSALAGQGFAPKDKDIPPSLLDLRKNIWEEHKKGLPTAPSPGAGTPTMPTTSQGLMPGMPGGGFIGVPQVPMQQGPVPGQPGMVAPNVNIQPAMATAPPNAFPQTQEQWESTYVHPAFALKIAAQKVKDDNIRLGRERVNNAIRATTNLIDHRRIDDDLRKSNYASLERNRKSLENFRGVLTRSIGKNDAIKQKLADSIMGFRDVEAAKMGLDVLNNWYRLDQSDRRLWNEEAKSASTNWNNLKNQVDALNNELDSLQKIKNSERNSRTWPEDPADQEKMLAPITQREREIDELLHGHMIPDPSGVATFTRDPQNPGAIQQMEDARAKMQAMPEKAQTNKSGKILPPTIQKAITKPVTKGTGQKPVFGLGKVKIYNPQTGQFE